MLVPFSERPERSVFALEHFERIEHPEDQTEDMPVHRRTRPNATVAAPAETPDYSSMAPPPTAPPLSPPEQKRDTQGITLSYRTIITLAVIQMATMAVSAGYSVTYVVEIAMNILRFCEFIIRFLI